MALGTNRSKDTESLQDEESSESSGGVVDFQDEEATSMIDGSSHHKSNSSSSGATLAGLSQDSVIMGDNPMVTYLRWVLVTVLVFSTVAVALAIRFYTNSEQNDLHNAFRSDARKVLDSIGQNFDLTMGAADAFMFRVVSQARSSGSVWPLVTIPDLAVQTAKLMTQTNSIYMAFYPLITKEKRQEWENFTKHNDGWVDEALTMRCQGPFLPSWMGSPVIPTWPPYNWNGLSGLAFAKSMFYTMETKSVVVTPVANNADPNDPVAAAQAKVTSDWAIPYLDPDEDTNEPFSDMYYPVLPSIDSVLIDPNSNEKAIGAVAFSFYWRHAIKNILPPNSLGLILVFHNDCGNQTFTYQVDGSTPTFLGFADFHEQKYNDLVISSTLKDLTNRDGTYTGLPMSTDYCPFTLSVYPSTEMEEHYVQNDPIYYALGAAFVFIFTSALFLFYDLKVTRRQRRIQQRALASGAIVSSIFPDSIKEKLIGSKEESLAFHATSKKRGNLKHFLRGGGTTTGGTGVGGGGANPDVHIRDKPIAELFLETTVMFADVVGFTAWSSVREPAQVFTLLETLYQSFDSVARKRRVFKVETVGDCYVAVVGLPDPRRDHASAMCRFGQDIISRMFVVTKHLELSLGPDTADLGLRIGIHSGPVTAGVLRGDRARFQLFGDTMNTTSRLESTGERNRIQCSKETAALLMEDGKGGWLEPRREYVNMKGKGSLETFFVNVSVGKANTASSVGSFAAALTNDFTSGVSRGKAIPGLDERTYRQIDWNVETLLRLIKQVVARRGPVVNPSESLMKMNISIDGLPLNEVREIIQLPEFDSNKSTRHMKKPSDVVIPIEVEHQLHHLVSCIASKYNSNPFHNFDHASHVVMAVTKLLSRITAPSHLEDLDECHDKRRKKVAASRLHDHTYGITSDPLTQVACAFAALIHDVDHVGVSNAQLVKEEVPIATKYKGRSVAEQNSVDLAWNLLMSPEYNSLRSFLFHNEGELIRFRQLVINSVMATDIVDKELKQLRNARWEKAFKTNDSGDNSDDNPRDEVNRKATIVIEHIIQASDISHTMQHWHVYRKWNQNLFEELYVAYLNGRMEKDPATFWYKGEFGFFDFYIIPLTRKLKECGVFGVSSDEYLNYALKNREEWETHGEEVVAQMIVECRKKYGTKADPETTTEMSVPTNNVEC
ncbi:Receptor-type guanylate cyclase gcy [Seminavis robusta]|uniref:Receptor-type guanylate cyclase gcy n=1 Tax=Seminavis robusta TaxID=568900 RepID=A0A9N8DF62_9STRA|nr:Receptor-type guanylate cyclase gcy [Seminavis robusta]|eukprot:Sro95_g049260.1 Receptor-type guanylate cyclase gcy (1175) ;mRNA; r:44731-50280